MLESAIIIELTTAIAVIGMATLLGYLGGKGLGAAILGLGAALASVLCIGGTLLGARLPGNTGGWIGLIAGMILAGILVPWALSKFILGRSRRFIAGLWFGFCALGMFGYLVAGWVGLVLITLPNLALFWWGLYVLSKHVLPVKTQQERWLAFRSLLTFVLGTNYPFYVINERELELRVPGNPFGQFFAGPGLVLSRCDHVPVITDGVTFKRIGQPGLTFTHKLEMVDHAVDLRPQLRSFTVEARTRDGVPVQVLTFVPFRIRGRQRGLKLGSSFPFYQRAVYSAVFGQPVEHGEKAAHRWDELVPITAERLLREVISRYTCEELAAPFDPKRDPRAEIRNELISTLREKMSPGGIEVIGGGISNLEPDEEALRRRIENWKATWAKRLRVRQAEAEQEAWLSVEQARAEADARFVQHVGNVLQGFVDRGETAALEAIRLRFVGALKVMARNLPDSMPLPEESVKTLRLLERSGKTNV